MLGVAGVAIVLAAVFVKTYRLETTANYQTICNSRECYVFVSQTHSGWMGSVLIDALRLVRMAFGGAIPPSDIDSETAVLTITSKGLGKTVVPGAFYPTDPYNDTVYAFGTEEATGGGLRRWTGQRLERPSVDEERSYHAASRSQKFNNQLPWSKQHLNLQAPFTVQLEDESLTIELVKDARGIQRIFLKRGPAREREIWAVDGSGRRVSRQEYVETFGPS